MNAATAPLSEFGLAEAWLIIGLIALCLAIEAFFSGAEVALVSADKGRLRRKSEAGSVSARRAQALMAHPEKLLSTTLIGTNLSVVTAAFLANELTARRFGPEASAWSILLMIPFIVLFGEILPKTVSRRHADAIALKVALPLSVAMTALSPVVALASAVARLALKPFHARGHANPFVTKEELRMLLQAEHRVALQHDEARLIKRLLDFADARAKEHMTPLVDVTSLPHDAKLHEASRLIHERGYSRLPVYTERVDNVTGIIEAMDLIDASPDETSLGRYVKKPLYVPETARIDRLLDEFRKSQQEMAIVVDEYGSAAGVLTLEDIVEEIVGDVLDEFDRPGRKGLERIGEGAFLVDGKLRLDELEEALGIEFPRAGYETVAGLVTHLFQKVPRAGERLVDDAFTITIVDSSPRAVRRVKIEARPSASRKPDPGR